jgi:hypothetical protein
MKDSNFNDNGSNHKKSSWAAHKHSYITFRTEDQIDVF